MEKKLLYLDRLFIILSIVFFSIMIMLLVINCFANVIYEVLFVGLFAFIIFINQIIFLPGTIKINKRKYINKKIHKYQFYIAVVMLVALFSSELIKMNDNVTLGLFGGLLSLFLIVYSWQNYDYIKHYDRSKKYNFTIRLILSIFSSSCLLIVLLYSLVSYFRGL